MARIIPISERKELFLQAQSFFASETVNTMTITINTMTDKINTMTRKLFCLWVLTVACTIGVAAVPDALTGATDLSAADGAQKKSAPGRDPIDFNHYFDGRTLRLDYAFAGDSLRQNIYIIGYAATPQWAGRRVNLDTLLLRGTASLTMRSLEDGRVIYRTSFSSHFQEWVGTRRAVSQPMSYEHIIQVPMPREEVEIEISLLDFREREAASLRHRFDPKDILIRKLQPSKDVESRYILHGGDPTDHIDIAILSEGYTRQELPKFYKDAERLTGTLFSYEPFCSNRERFNVVAVGMPSPQSGVSEPGKGHWVQTNLGTFFDFEDTERLLGLTNLVRVGDALAGVEWEHIIVLANTDTYGGAGVYNSYEITAAQNRYAPEVLVHEFGHSFGGLGDEYFDDDQYTQYYYPELEPWNPNLTTLHSFFDTKSDRQTGSLWGELKWADMLTEPTSVPTELKDGQSQEDTETIGLYEGGGYMSKGVYRPAYNCRMRTNSVRSFCPVCRRALKKMIDYHLSPME